MKSPNKRELAAWKSASAWMVSESGVLPALVVDPTAVPTVPTAFGLQVTAFQTVIANLSAAAATQEQQQGTAKGSTASAASLRSTLWDVHMKPIAQVARAVIADVPSAAPALELPATRIDQQGLLAAATAMAGQAENYEQVLIANGLPSDFIAQLQDATAALDQAFTARRQATAARTGATATIAAQFVVGRTALALINAMLVRQFGTGSVMLAAWDSARRVVASPTSGAAPVAPVTPSVPTAAPALEPAAAHAGSAAVVLRPIMAEEREDVGADAEARAA